MIKEFIVIMNGLKDWNVYRLEKDLDGRVFYRYFCTTNTYNDAEEIATDLNKK